MYGRKMTIYTRTHEQTYKNAHAHACTHIKSKHKRMRTWYSHQAYRWCWYDCPRDSNAQARGSSATCHPQRKRPHPLACCLQSLVQRWKHNRIKHNGKKTIKRFIDIQYENRADCVEIPVCACVCICVCVCLCVCMCVSVMRCACFEW